MDWLSVDSGGKVAVGVGRRMEPYWRFAGRRKSDLLGDSARFSVVLRLEGSDSFKEKETVITVIIVTMEETMQGNA